MIGSIIIMPAGMDYVYNFTLSANILVQSQVLVMRAFIDDTAYLGIEDNKKVL